MEGKQIKPQNGLNDKKWDAWDTVSNRLTDGLKVCFIGAKLVRNAGKKITDGERK